MAFLPACFPQVVFSDLAANWALGSAVFELLSKEPM
jgi:hypothetical protein